MKTEQTSKRVASKAGKLMNEMIYVRANIISAINSLERIKIILQDIESIAASALTQSPNKSKGKRK